MEVACSFSCCLAGVKLTKDSLCHVDSFWDRQCYTRIDQVQESAVVRLYASVQGTPRLRR